MRKLLTSALLVIGAMLLFALPASAGRTWCRADPVFSVDGKLIKVEVLSDPAIRTATTGPIKLVLSVPAGSSVQLLETDTGFGYGYDISIAYVPGLKMHKMHASVFVPATNATLPVQIEVTSLSLSNGNQLITGKGVVNTWVAARVK